MSKNVTTLTMGHSLHVDGWWHGLAVTRLIRSVK